MEELQESYYRKTTPKLIKKLELMIEECLKIVGQKIDGDISDDKMVNVIKSKKLAAETAQWGASEIDSLQSELNNEFIPPKGKKQNFSEQLAS